MSQLQHIVPPLASSAAERLLALLVQRREQGFVWGVRDCWLLAADAVQAIHGRDPAADLRGCYTSALQARRLLGSLGGAQGLLQARVGPRLAPHAQPADGCIALVGSHRVAGAQVGSGAFGVVWRGRVVAQGGASLVSVPLDDAQAFWWPLAELPA